MGDPNPLLTFSSNGPDRRLVRSFKFLLMAGLIVRTATNKHINKQTPVLKTCCYGRKSFVVLIIFVFSWCTYARLQLHVTRPRKPPPLPCDLIHRHKDLMCAELKSMSKVSIHRFGFHLVMCSCSFGFHEYFGFMVLNCKSMSKVSRHGLDSICNLFMQFGISRVLWLRRFELYEGNFGDAVLICMTMSKVSV